MLRLKLKAEHTDVWCWWADDTAAAVAAVAAAEVLGVVVPVGNCRCLCRITKYFVLLLHYTVVVGPSSSILTTRRVQ